jgi:antitoxin YefM
METVFRLKASEIDSRFLSTLKTLFKKREIEITVSDVINDETDFLLNDPKNKAHLLEAIEEVKHNKNLVRFSGDEFKKYSKSLSKK